MHVPAVFVWVSRLCSSFSIVQFGIIGVLILSLTCDCVWDSACMCVICDSVLFHIYPRSYLLSRLAPASRTRVWIIVSETG